MNVIRIRVFLFLAVSLLLSLGTSAQAQLLHDVSVNVTEEDGLFTYEYTVSNELFSSALINYFAVDTTVGTDVVGATGAPSPNGWAGGYFPLNDLGQEVTDQQVAHLTGDGISCGVEAGAITQGDDLSFTIESLYQPGDQNYTLGFFDATCDFAAIATGPVIGPTTAPVLASSCDLDGDGDCDVSDVDSLVAIIVAGENTAGFDLNNDDVVDGADLEAWLSDSGVNRLNGDLNLNGEVAFDDFLILSANFGKADVAWSGGDLVPSGDVGFEDFLVFSANFGQQVPQAAAIPEPSSHVLIGTLCLSLLALRRKESC